MTCAALLSLEGVRDTQRRAESRQRLHERFDHWLNLLEDRMKDGTPTLEELTPLAPCPAWIQEVTKSLVA